MARRIFFFFLQHNNDVLAKYVCISLQKPDGWRTMKVTGLASYRSEMAAEAFVSLECGPSVGSMVVFAFGKKVVP